MPKVAFTIECNESRGERSHAREYLKFFDEENIPVTWFIPISESDQGEGFRDSLKYYSQGLPITHEIGVKISFNRDGQYLESAQERSDVLKFAVDIIKQSHLSVHSIRSDSSALLPNDLQCFSDLNIQVDSSYVPEEDFVMMFSKIQEEHRIANQIKDGLQYNKSDDLFRIPVTSTDGKYALLEKGFESVKAMVEPHLSDKVVCVNISTDSCHLDDLKRLVFYFRLQGAVFASLAQIVGVRTVSQERKSA